MKFTGKILSAIILISFALSACKATPATPQATQTPLPPTETPVPSPTAAPEPRVLTICLGQEPQTLYLYNSSARSMWAVLEAIYDGPIDTRGFESVPVILEKMPSQADGDAVYAPVTVQPGTEIVDANGDLSVLAKGVRYLPAGCSEDACAAAWDGSSEVKMDALTLTFKFLPDLKWSDGQPLTAQDSVYSFNVSNDPATPVNRRMLDRTAAYTALDERTLNWVSIPGFRTARYADGFWNPLPEHVYSQYSAAELLIAEISTRQPLGWGAYVIEEWTAGDHITLKPNPSYFRAAEGLPRFDALVYRFLGEQSGNNLQALYNGECDIVDQTVALEVDIEKIQESEAKGELKIWVGQGPEWEQINYGIVPAAYDDGIDFYGRERPDFFGDVRMRRAFALCIDRQKIVDDLYGGLAEVPLGFFPLGHPLYTAELDVTGFNPIAGSELLEEIGWKDEDQDAATPRVARGVPNVPDGQPLQIIYLTTPGGRSESAGQAVAISLAQCGVQVAAQPVEAQTLYAAGPEGALFGRQFELAQFAWQIGRTSPCTLYESRQIPSADNNWIGTNLPGFSDPAYDAACLAARQALPEEAGYAEKQEAVQVLYVEALPSLPLYFRIKMDISRPDLCNFGMDVSARSEFWNLEELDYGIADCGL